MLRVFKVAFLLILSSLVSSEHSMLFVSLGSHCEIAGSLSGNGLRKVAFPFDWLLTFNLDGLIECIEERFQYFLDERYFSRHPDFCHMIENSYYQIEFRHDWPFPEERCSPERYALQTEKMREKYPRRIERFYDLNHYPGKVFFIRIPFDYSIDPNPYWNQPGIDRIEADEARKLQVVLSRVFPDLDFRVVIINYLESSPDPLSEIGDVMEFKVSRSNKDLDYQRIFEFIKSCR